MTASDSVKWWGGQFAIVPRACIEAIVEHAGQAKNVAGSAAVAVFTALAATAGRDGEAEGGQAGAAAMLGMAQGSVRRVVATVLEPAGVVTRTDSGAVLLHLPSERPARRAARPTLPDPRRTARPTRAEQRAHPRRTARPPITEETANQSDPPVVPPGQLALVQQPSPPAVRPRGTPSAGPLLDFDAFWAVYPKRAGKAAARRAWQKATKLANPADIIAGAVRYRDDPNRDPAYTKMAQGWLNDGRWEDDPLPERRPSTRPGDPLAALDEYMRTRSVRNEPALPPPDPGWLTMPAIGGAT